MNHKKKRKRRFIEYQIGQIGYTWQWLVDNEFEGDIGQHESESQLEAILRQGVVHGKSQERQAGYQKLK